MKFNRKMLAVLAMLGLVCVAIPTLRADDDDAPKRPAPPAAGAPGAAKVSLEAEMKAMGRDYRTIRQQVKDSTKNASTLAALADLELHTVIAKAAIPRTATTMPTEDQKKEKATDYRKDMADLVRTELDMEDALLSGDNDKAAKISDTMHKLEESGHQNFRPKKERD